MNIRSGALPFFLSIILLFPACTQQQNVENPETEAATGAEASQQTQFRNGMVSSAHPLATEAGLMILRNGGNAFDAAVAVAATLNVVEPMMSGMGGYGTILVYSAEDDVVRFLNSSGRIPAAVDSDMFRPPTPGYEENRRGPMAVSTPGNVNAWWELGATYGKTQWQDLYAEAIRLAEEGFEVYPWLAGFIETAWEDMTPYTRAFYGRDGRPLKAGEVLVQKDLAGSLRAIAEDGPRAFSHGEIADRLDAAVQGAGGFLSKEDLQRNRAEWWEPISIDYRGHTVYTAAPPSTAFPSLIRLGLMRQFDPSTMEHNGVHYLHRFIEVTKYAFRARLMYAGDPDVAPPPLDMLLGQEHLAAAAENIRADVVVPFTYPGLEPAEVTHTTHFVVADAQGNIVSATQTLGNLFGSRIMPEGTGIWLNNSLAYCTFEPKGNPMDAHPGRRKLSGDCPTIIFRDGRPWAALGTPGGHTIGQTVPQMVMNLIDFDMLIEQAIAAPRVSFVEPDWIAWEEGIAPEVIAALQARGHFMRKAERGIGNAHGLVIHRGNDGSITAFEGGADPRGIGLASGW